MERIASFSVDHRRLLPGLYTSRRDSFAGVEITSYDLRMRRPYLDPPLTASEAHSIEHLLATWLRNSAAGPRIVYVGPMGCLTGFYVLAHDIDWTEMRGLLQQAFCWIAETADEIPGNSRDECGDCRTLSLVAGKKAAAAYLEILNGPLADNAPVLGG